MRNMAGYRRHGTFHDLETSTTGDKVSNRLRFPGRTIAVVLSDPRPKAKAAGRVEPGKRPCIHIGNADLQTAVDGRVHSRYPEIIPAWHFAAVAHDGPEGFQQVPKEDPLRHPGDMA